ncbi:hypothetical protein LBMAG46_09420 [Planctomycetia bacterium]|nr:hypothetical protein LBMAG46_09420 [Planctomycetia bacterium]
MQMHPAGAFVRIAEIWLQIRQRQATGWLIAGVTADAVLLQEASRRRPFITASDSFDKAVQADQQEEQGAKAGRHADGFRQVAELAGCTQAGTGPSYCSRGIYRQRQAWPE